MRMVVKGVDVFKSAAFNFKQSVPIFLLQVHARYKYKNLKAGIGFKDLDQRFYFAEIGARTGKEQDFFQQRLLYNVGNGVRIREFFNLCVAFKKVVDCLIGSCKCAIIIENNNAAFGDFVV